MARRKRKPKPEHGNRRLDEFLNELRISQDKKRRILEFVEHLTFEQVKRHQAKRLRKP